MTLGFDVLVQLVMAAITTEPSSIISMRPSISTVAARWASPSVLRKFFLTSGRSMRSCGRLGPASDGTTFERSSSMVSWYVGSGESSVRNSPCSLAYDSTSAIRSGGRFVMRR